MKLKALTTATLLTAMAGLALALPDSDPPKPQPDRQIAEQEDRAPAMEQVTYLGINTSALRPEARRTLDLKPGTGLVIQHVGTDTPAAAAGLLTGDVLVRLNDQLLINEQQLSVLVRTFVPGDTVTLSVLRQGEPIKVKATLAGTDHQPQPRLIERGPMHGLPVVPGLGDFDALFEQLRGPGLDPFVPGADLRDMLDQMQGRMFEQRNEMQRMMDQMRQRIGAQGMQSAVSVNDGEHILQLKSNGQSRHLTVKTIAGDVLFDGPLPEDGQVDALPEAVQKKVDDLLKNYRIEFRMPRPQQRDPLLVA